MRDKEGSNAIRFEREVIDINVGLLVRIIFLSKLFYPTGQVHRHQEDSSSQHSASFSTKQPQELTLLNKPVFFLLLWKKNRGHLLMTSNKKLFNRNLIFYDGKLTDWSLIFSPFFSFFRKKMWIHSISFNILTLLTPLRLSPALLDFEGFLDRSTP